MCAVYIHIAYIEHVYNYKAAPSGDAEKEEPSHAPMDVEKACMILHATVLKLSGAAMSILSPILHVHMQDPSGGIKGDTAEDCLS